MKRLAICHALIALSMIALSCGTSDRARDVSRVAYGIKADHPSLMIHLKSGAWIGVCGHPRDIYVLDWAMNEWGRQIGRHYSTYYDCDNPWVRVYRVNEPTAIKMCAPKGPGQRTARAWAAASPQLLVDCGSGWTDETMVHEVGHLFGLCDTYEGSTCPNLESVVHGAIMNTATGTTLQRDDINGIRELARRYPVRGG